MNNEVPVYTGIEAEKVIFNVQVKPGQESSLNSVNLDINERYFAEPHGMNHYYISKFHNVKASQMGVYRKSYFKIIGTMDVTYEPRLHELKPMRNNGLLNEDQLMQLEAFENGTYIPQQPQKVVDEEDAVPVISTEPTALAVGKPEHVIVNEQSSIFNSLLSDDERTHLLAERRQNELLRPANEDYPNDLSHDEVYIATLRWVNKGYSVEVNQDYFIQRVAQNNALYADMDCYVYKDATYETKLLSRFKLAWFENFRLIAADPEVSTEASVEDIAIEVESIQVNEIVTKAVEEVKVDTPISNLPQIVENVSLLEVAPPTNESTKY